MEGTTTNKLELFFTTLNQLIVKGKIKRGKDFKIVEFPDGKALYLHLESIYAIYSNAVGMEAASLIDIRNMLQSSSFFMKYTKKVKFEWKEILKDTAVVNHSVNISAPTFRYDVLKEKYNIDFERYRVEDFETALLQHKIDIEEIRLDGGAVKFAKGTICIDEKRTKELQWHVSGKCYSKYLNRVPEYDLKFE